MSNASLSTLSQLAHNKAAHFFAKSVCDIVAQFKLSIWCVMQRFELTLQRILRGQG